MQEERIVVLVLSEEIEMHTSFRVVLGLSLIMICALFFAYKHHSVFAANSQPAYFQSMEEGHRYEKDKNYEQAIGLYTQALQQIPEVDSDLRMQGKIAVHNRIAACYRSIGQMDKAAAEFKVSISLGDTKYAPKALVKIK